MKDVECPYCGEDQYVNHDDGFGYSEDVRHEMECQSCDKIFVFTTGIIYVYGASKADCLNGADHTYREMVSSVPEWTRMACQNCDHERPPTADELEKILERRG